MMSHQAEHVQCTRRRDAGSREVLVPGRDAARTGPWSLRCAFASILSGVAPTPVAPMDAVLRQRRSGLPAPYPVSYAARDVVPRACRARVRTRPRRHQPAPVALRGLHAGRPAQSDRDPAGARHAVADVDRAEPRRAQREGERRDLAPHAADRQLARSTDPGPDPGRGDGRVRARARSRRGRGGLAALHERVGRRAGHPGAGRAGRSSPAESRPACSQARRSPSTRSPGRSRRPTSAASPASPGSRATPTSRPRATHRSRRARPPRRPPARRGRTSSPPDAVETRFTLDQTDANQHVNSAVYVRYFLDAVQRRLAAGAYPAKLRSKAFDIAYRKPCFVGDRVRAHIRHVRAGRPHRRGRVHRLGRRGGQAAVLRPRGVRPLTDHPGPQTPGSPVRNHHCRARQPVA